MDFSTAAAAHLALWTITRFAALAVLATEALFLWSRRREKAPGVGPTASRFFWAATPALILAGLSVWCLASIAAGAPGAALSSPAAIAQLR